MLYIPLTKKQRSRVGKTGVSLSIGTWVRIPGPPKTLSNFFSRYSHAALQAWIIKCPQISMCQVASGQDPKARFEHPPYSLVNKHAGNHKGQTGWRNWALKIANHAPRSGPHLPEYFFFTFYFFFLFVYLLLLLLS